MSTGKGGPDESRKDVADETRLSARAHATLRRIFAGLSAAIATMSRKASSSSLAAKLEARVPPEWRRPRRWLLIGGVVLVVVLIIVTRATTIQRHPAAGTTVYPVGNRVVLRFVRSNGSVHVAPGPDGQVSIKENRSGVTGAIQTRYRKQGDTITVTVSVETGLTIPTWVDFDVAVPQDTSTNFAVAAGTLEASHLNGNVVLQDTNGSIGAANVSGTIALHTTSGSISASNVSGQFSAITDNGTITTNSTRLGGHSLVQAQNGTINFHGSLDPGSHALFRNNNGAIAVTLPDRSSLIVDARTPHGSINSEFPSVRVGANVDGRLADGRVGRGAPARLSIRTMGGSISLNRAG
jgi:Putative adhesin